MPSINQYRLGRRCGSCSVEGGAMCGLDCEEFDEFKTQEEKKLAHAAVFNLIDTARELIGRGVPITYTVNYAALYGNLEMLELMLRQGANPRHIDLEMCDEEPEFGPKVRELIKKYYPNQ